MQSSTNQVIISICCRELIHAETMRWCLVETQRSGRNVQITNTPYPIDHQRNQQIESFFQTDADWFFLLDSDEVPQPDTIDRLLALGEPVCAAPSYRWGNSGLEMMIYDREDGEDGRRFYVPHKPTTGIQTVAAVGPSGLLISRGVLEQLPRPMFQSLYTDAGLIRKSEDIYFCEVLQDAGYEIVVDCSLVQTHIKSLALPF